MQSFKSEKKYRMKLINIYLKVSRKMVIMKSVCILTVPPFAATANNATTKKKINSFEFILV